MSAIRIFPIGIPMSDLRGMQLANNVTDATNDIDITAGSRRDSTDVEDIVGAASTKRLDAAWAVGSGSGGLDTGSIANTTYHVFTIKRLDTGVVDYLFSTSATAPTMPTNYTVFRRLGAILRVSAAIIAFLQDGDMFWRATVTDYSSTSNRALSLLTLSVPLGIKVRPILSTRMVQNAVGAIQLDFAPGDNSALVTATFSQTRVSNQSENNSIESVLTNTSGQIYLGVTISSGSLTACVVNTSGWFDTRERNA